MNKQMNRVDVKLSQAGIDFLKSQKRIYTNLAWLIGKDADSIKRWIRTNHVRLVGADVVEAVRQLTNEDLTKYFEGVTAVSKK